MAYLLGVLAYLIGSAPIGLIIGRMVLGVDIRRYGSGNIGATNVLRVLGPRWAAAVFVLDAAKGFLPVLAGRYVGLDTAALAVIAALAVAGHNWSIFLRFQGGKGVAASFGALLAVGPIAAVGAALVWLLVVAVSGFASLGSMFGLLSSAVFLHVFEAPAPYVVLGLVLSGMAVWQHRANIQRLVRGKELKFNQRVSPGDPRS